MKIALISDIHANLPAMGVAGNYDSSVGADNKHCG